MKKSNIRKVFLMIADAVLIVLSSLFSNAILALIGILVHGSTDYLAVQPVRIAGRLWYPEDAIEKIERGEINV